MAQRGSERLLEAWKRGGFDLSEELVERLTKATEEFEISDAYLKGTPTPNVLRASFDVEGEERCGNGVRSILQALTGLGIGSNGRIIVFPKGIPADRFVVSLELGGE